MKSLLHCLMKSHPEKTSWRAFSYSLLLLFQKHHLHPFSKKMKTTKPDLFRENHSFSSPLVPLYGSLKKPSVLWIFLLMVTGNLAFSQPFTLNEYRSANSGNWNSLSTWQRFNGATFVNATTIPNAVNSAKIRIQNTHTVTIDAGVSGESVIVEAGGILITNATLSINQLNSSLGLTLNGKMVMSGSGSIQAFGSSANMQVNDSLIINKGTIAVSTEITFNGVVLKQSSEVLDFNTFITVNNFGIFLWNGGGISFSAVTFRNRDTGEFYMLSGFFFSGGGSSQFINDGFFVTTPTGAGGPGIPFTNNFSGIVSGNGSVSSSTGFVNSGELRPGVTATNIARTRFLSTPTLNTTSLLSIKIKDGAGPGVGHDQVVFHANTTLNGTLTVEEMEGATIPNGSYTIVRTSDITKTFTGNFTTINVPTGYTVEKNDTVVRVIKGASASAYVFNGDGNWSNPSNWQSGEVPPGSLPSLSSITVAGNCTLDVNQTIENGGIVTVNAGENFLIPTTSTFALSGKLVNNGSTQWNASGQILISTGGSETISGTGSIIMNASEILLSTIIKMTENGTLALNASTRIGIGLSGIEVANGNLSMSANQNGTATGDLLAITVNASTLITRGTGNILLNGKGLSDNSASQTGILITGNSTIESEPSSGGGRIEINGVGGAGTGVNIGVFVNQSSIKTKSGDIILNGSSIGLGDQNFGLVVQTSANIESQGSGKLLLTGSGSANGNSFNRGIQITGSSLIQSSGGLIDIQGNGFGNLDQNHGVRVDASISAVGTARMRIKGVGSPAGSTNSVGIRIGSSGFITSLADSIVLIGTGGGTTNGDGVQIAGGAISALNQSRVAVFGAGSLDGESNNNGVSLTGNFSSISSSSSPIYIEAKGGGTGINNMGLQLATSARITTTAGGKIKILARGSVAGTDSCSGVALKSGSTITSAGDSIAIQAFGNGTGNVNTGLSLTGGSSISATNGVVQINANGSTTGAEFNHGISIKETDSRISSSLGKLLIAGKAGGSGNSNSGIFVSKGRIDASSSTSIDVTGFGGGSGATGTENYGIYVENLGIIRAGNLPSAIQGVAGAGNSTGIKLSNSTFGSLENRINSILITGTGSGSGTDVETFGTGNRIGSLSASGPITVVANTYEGGKINTSNLINIKPRTASVTIGLGDGTGTLQLSNAELAGLVNSFGNITIGDATSGNGLVTIKNATVPFFGKVVGGSVRVSGLENVDNSVTLEARTGNVSDLDDSGIDISGSKPIKLLFPNGSLAPGNSPGIFSMAGNYTHTGLLSIEVGGPVAGTGFDQLNVAGSLIIGTGSTLQASLINEFSPGSGQSFDVAIGTSLTNTFQNTNLPPGWTISYLSDRVRLTAPTSGFTPTLLANGTTTFCEGGSVQLEATDGAGFLHKWFRNGVEIVGQTSATLAASLAGTYKAEVTNASSQTAETNEIAVTVNPTPTTPTITAGGPTTFCAGGSVQLTSSSASGNVWSNGSTTQSITVTASGSFAVQTVALGCSSAVSSATAVVVNPTPATPAITAGGPTTFCAGGSVQLTSSAASGNVWSNGSTTQSITVTASGSFAVQTVASGCSSEISLSTQVIVNPLPVVLAGPDVSISTGESTTLAATGALTYIWSPLTALVPPNGTGASVVASPIQTTLYTVTGTDANNCSNSDQVLVTITGGTGPLTAPVISHPTGTYDGPQTVTITSTSPGAEIYYTTSGNLPVVGTGFTKLYTGPFSLLASGTVRAIAVKTGLPNSPVSVSFLTITNPGIVATPTISPGSGSFTGSVIVAIASTTAGAEIWYTTNGNNPRLDIPNGFTRLYTGPFTLFGTTTIKAVGVKSGLVSSGIAATNFVVNNPAVVAAPTFSPAPGNYATAQSVEITSSTPGAQIFYTTNGNTPRFDVPNSFTKLYTGPLTISSNSTLKAVATLTGFLPSPTAVGNYTIGAGRMAIAEADLNYFFEVAQNDPVEGDINIRLFPNPSQGRFFILNESGAEEAAVIIVNMLGQTIWEGKMDAELSQLEIDITLQPAGIYSVQYVSQGQKKEFLVVKK